MASVKAFQVFSDPAMLRQITSFQFGIPVELFAFWASHPDNSYIKPAERALQFWRSFSYLPSFVVINGDLRMLQIVSRINDHTARLGTRRRLRLDFSKMVEYAITRRQKDLELLAWTVDFGVFRSDLSDYFWWAMMNLGDLRIAALPILMRIPRFAASIKPDMLTKPTELYSVIEDVELLRWLHTNLPQLQWDGAAILKIAVHRGQVDMVRYVFQHYPETKWEGGWMQMDNLYSTFGFGMGLPRAGYWDCVRCLLQDYLHAMLDSRIMVFQVIHGGKRELLEIIAELGVFKDTVLDAINGAILVNDYRTIARYEEAGLLSREKPFSIAPNSRIEMVDYLVERGLVRIEVLLEKCESIDDAAAHGALEQVQRLYASGITACTTKALDEAAKFDNISLIKYLSEVVDAPCTTTAMDNAGSCGHVNIVKYLHHHRREGCTTEAMDGAAANGHLDVVMFLQQYRSEGCTEAAVKRALTGDHLAVVEFLYEHYRQFFTPDLLQDLLMRGAFGIWQSMRIEYPDQAEIVMEVALPMVGRGLRLPAIDFIVNQLGLHGFGESVFRSTYGSVHAHIAVWRVAGPDCCTLDTVRTKRFGNPMFNDAMKFIIRACTDPSAIEKYRAPHWQLNRGLEEWDPETLNAATVECHPLLMITRTPHWLATAALIEAGDKIDYLDTLHPPITWARRAIYRGDQAALEVIYEASQTAAGRKDPAFSFEHARAIAIRCGNLRLLQWLVANVVDLPIEPTLLDEAIYFHRFDIALWLVEHCVNGCVVFDPASKCGLMRVYRGCGFDKGVLDWLESDEGESVRARVDFGALAWYAVAQGDVAGVRRLVATHGEAVRRWRPRLEKRAACGSCADSRAMLSACEQDNPN